MERYHRHIIERCTLGLWHGDDCFRAYSPWCKENHLIHDVHTKLSDLIDGQALEEKLRDVRSAETLRLCYTGRLDPMKAPLEWLLAIATARDLGVELRATWYGEGPLRAEAIEERARLQLDEVVDFPGFVSGRAELLAHVRAAHALVFTHVTPESPRNLLEALVSGTPILGYDNAYAVNLLASEGGGALVPVHDAKALGRLIQQLAGDREKLVQLTREAARNGRRFSDVAVFRERSELIQRYA
jgi:glycosyltransferase involved in cell wall biosynthesis